MYTIRDGKVVRENFSFNGILPSSSSSSSTSSKLMKIILVSGLAIAIATGAYFIWKKRSAMKKESFGMRVYR